MKKFGAIAATLSLVFGTSICWSANRVIDISDSEKVQVYDEPGSFTWIAPNNLTGTAQLLVVGGGGAGGGINSGGGGGGEVYYNASVTFGAGVSYSVTVGDGGAGVSKGNGMNGGDSSISGTGISYTVAGGGGGAGTWSRNSGNAGGSGGGAGGNGNTPMDGAASTATIGMGHAGGNAGDKYSSPAGGGGAMEVGHMWNEVGKKGYGGAGYVCSITGSEIMYGYGGGAGSGMGGLSGAQNEWGRGCKNDSDPDQTQGEDGTGGGGGASSWQGADPGADGGCGTVIIRYTLDTAKDDFSANITRSIRVPTTVTFTAALGTELSTMTWNFGDGSEEVQTTELTVTHEYAAAGVYTVTMTHGSQVVSKPDYIEIISGVLYVDAASTNPTPPYNTRATAATKVNDAMAYAQNGFEIRIAPGDYPLNDTLSDGGNRYIDVTNAVTVIGEGDSPTDVVLRSPRRRMWYNDKVMRINNAGAKVVNVTLADGSVSNGGWGGCLLIDSVGGVVSNCVIRNGLAFIATQARAGGAYLNGGLVTHTVFEDCSFNANYSLSNTRLASGAVLAGRASIENCLFRNCTGSAGDIIALTYPQASVVNCTVVGGQIGFWTGNNNVTNDSYAIGGEQGVVKNCAVYNVKRIAYNDQPETYDAAFGPADSVFASCVKASKGDFRNYDAGNLMPHVGGALYDKGTAIDGFSNIKDLAGNPRVFGKAIDVGCYESQISPGFMLFVR